MIDAVPIPHDIPLPLPVDPIVAQALLVVSFLAHILFVLLMVGGSLLTVVAELLGLRRPDYDVLAKEIAATITVNKSLAVVLGVAPLLVINVFYTEYFYSANALTGTAWIMLVPLVTLAFLLGYAHKYSWTRLAASKPLHVALGASAAALFLFIPLVFLANINLMLFPDRWTQVHGFLSALWLPNALPRYLHFLLAAVAITALFLLAYFTRAAYPVETMFQNWDRPALRRGFYTLAFAATIAQLFAGPLLFFTLPSVGMSWYLVLIIGLGLVLALVTLSLLWGEMQSASERVGRRFFPIVVLLTLVVCCMGYGRHVYRESAVSGHRRQMFAKTDDFQKASAAAAFRAAAGLDQDKTPLGQRVFEQVCASCHDVNRVLVGPSITEIAGLYANNPDGIVKWSNNPGRKRMFMPPMAPQRIGDAKLKAVAEYMLERGSTPKTSPADAASQPAA